jgi:hypothetical protein
MNHRTHSGFLAAAMLFAAHDSTAASVSTPVRATVKPDRVFNERSGDIQNISFDIQFSNDGAMPLEIVGVRMRGFDGSGRLMTWNKLDANGSRPSLEVLGPRRIEAGKELIVFNPFQELRTPAPLALLKYEFTLSGPGGARTTTSFEVRPVEYVQKTVLSLPVAGVHLWAYDAGGYLSHHRRLDLSDPFNRDVMHMRANTQRYALDLVVVNEAGDAFVGDLAKKENWVGYGVPVLAPAPGKIVLMESSQPNEMEYDQAIVTKDPRVEVGNYVIIDHGNGEYSMLAHFQTGSVVVKPGDEVKRGQLLGRMGRSGMGSGLIHVHYELRTAAGLFDGGEGLPTGFDSFRRIGGTSAESGGISSGWIVATPPFATSPLGQ